MDAAARTFVGDARVARLATAGPDRAPHVVPVCFALHDDRIYIALDEKPKRVPVERLRRVRNIAANPHVQLVIDRYEEDWTRLAFVQLSGDASLLAPGSAAHGEAIGLLRGKYHQYRDMDLESRPVIRIDVTKVTSWAASG